MNQTDIWRKSLDILQQNIKKADFLVWYQGTNIIKIEQGVAIIGLPSIFAKDWLQ